MTLRRSITNELVREASQTSTYYRGRDLYRWGTVKVSGIHREAGFADVDGLAYGSGADPYGVSLVVDERENTVVEYSCTCPAYAKYDGMCKHIIAMGLEYLDLVTGSEGGSGVDAGASAEALRRQKGLRRQAAQQTPASGPKPKPKPKPVRSSYAISNLLASYASAAQEEVRLASAAAGIVDDAQEPVDLQCVLSSGENAYRYSWSNSDTWSLGLKVVRGKTNYVVKRIDELVNAWHSGEVVRYGKNLEFAHRPAAFTDRANALMTLLSDVLETQQSLYVAQENRFYRNDRLSSKTLPLSSGQMVQVLDIMLGQKVVVETLSQNYNWGSRAKRTIPVVEGNPRLEVQIAPVGVKVAGSDGKMLGVAATPMVGASAPIPAEPGELADASGYHLTVFPDSFECIRGGGALYLVGEDAVYRCEPAFAEKLGPFCAALFPTNTAFDIALSDMPGFCASVLQPLRDFTRLTEPAGLALDTLMPPRAEFRFRIAMANGYISCTASVLYDDVELSLFEPVQEGQPTRHVVREMAAQQVVRTYFPDGDVELPDYSKVKQRGYDTVYGGGYGSSGYADRWYTPKRPANPLEPDVPWFAETDDAAYYLLFAEGLRELAALGEVLLSDRLRGVKVRQAPSVRVDASVRGGLLDIAVESTDMTPAELVSYLASYERKQKFVRLGNGDIVRLDGSVSAVADLAGGLGLDAESLVEGVNGLPANRTLFVDAMMKRASGVRFERDPGFRSIVRDFETIADADFVAPGAFREVLRPYQVEGFRWLCTLGKAGFGGILADDMGLGKTLQMMAYLAFSRDEGERRPALVVCPASLVYNWAAEFARFSPDTRVAVVAGGKQERLGQISAGCAADAGGEPGAGGQPSADGGPGADENPGADGPGADGNPGADVLITSYDLMKRDVEAYIAQDFSCVVLDEAQYIKNATTKAAKAAKQLPASVRFALTGTPIENRLSELWSIFDFLMPGVLGSSESFARRFATPIGDGDEAVARRLQGLVSPFILRRLKGDVLRDLPEKNESIVIANMEGEQDKLYRASATKLALMLSDQKPEEFAGMKLKVLAELTKLRQLCCDPSLLYENFTGSSAKLETCMELVRSAVEGGHQVLLFSQFTSMFDIIGARLAAEGVGFLQLTGATSKEERIRLVERFQAGAAPVFLISLKAGGVGLNLTAADIVIHYDPWWNLAAQNQATDRAHRIGQEKQVSVFKIIAKDTIEEKIVAMQEAKHDLAEQVIGGEAVSRTSITRDDILALLDAGDRG